MLFLCAAVVGCTALWLQGVREPLGYLRVCIDPSVAAGILTVASGLNSSLVGPTHWRPPQNFTLPIVFLGVMIGFKVLSDSGRALSYRMGEPARFDLIWYSWPYLAIVGVLGAGFLSYLMHRSQVRTRDFNDDSSGVQ